MESIALLIILAPLLGSIIAGLFPVSRTTAHRVTISGVFIAFALSVYAFIQVALLGQAPFTVNGEPSSSWSVYTWLQSGSIRFEIGFLLDSLTVLMMVVVTFVSWMVHIYTIGYMEHDEHNWSDGSRAGTNSYQRFFSYISLFTFSMLMLVMSNNFLQLFFGWEAVGLVSYLLIGFWFQRDTATYANLKAFLVNRVGDFGFLLGIAAVLMYFNSLNYQEVFANTSAVSQVTISIWPGTEWSLMTVICILLFIGAMGKSAQVPLHVWLPDSMEGPTPISALIHAATMVTAGIFMVARMSPLYELSETALSFILVIGAITALFMGFLGLVQNDIKRVVAYSTLSQLGYMTVALGASAYAAGVFHLMTHAFFKALLFLSAGSVIIAMHHEQDMRKMGGLKKYMPITYITSLVGSLALIGTPFFSGFFSKDTIIEAVHLAQEAGRPGAAFAFYAVLAGVFVTALYSFRMFILVFHGKERMDEHTRSHLHETPWVVTGPLIALAIPSVLAGFIIGPVVFGDFFKDSIYVADNHDVLTAIGYHGIFGFVAHAFMQPAIYLAIAGVVTAVLLYKVWPEIPAQIQRSLSWLHTLMVNKYYLDDINQKLFGDGARWLGGGLWKIGDTKIIDGAVVNGSARLVGWFSGVLRHVQTGYLYHYAFAMIIGLVLLLALFVHLQ